MDDQPWFAAKRFGYGAGLPIRWQGWAILALFMIVLFGAGFVLPPPAHPVGYGIVVVADVAVFAMIAARRTQGGWRWRSGGGA